MTEPEALQSAEETPTVRHQPVLLCAVWAVCRCHRARLQADYPLSQLRTAVGSSAAYSRRGIVGCAALLGAQLAPEVPGRSGARTAQIPQ